jgi:2'-5' RNA ligase
MIDNTIKIIFTLILTNNALACTPSTASVNADELNHGEQQGLRYVFDPKALDGTSVPFVKHEEDKPFGSYLIMNLPYAPVKALFDNIEQTTGKKLINRGEAHITVVTPVEYDKVLRKHLTIKEITKIALDFDIQSAAFDVECLGKGELKDGRDLLVTYFIVTPSKDLLEIRKAVEQKFINSGGSPGEFNAQSFYPHITVGYSKRDLHFEEGIIKDATACTANLNTP